MVPYMSIPPEKVLSPPFFADGVFCAMDDEVVDSQPSGSEANSVLMFVRFGPVSAVDLVMALPVPKYP